MSKFGWSYPAGCSGPPDENGGEPCPGSEEAWALLESHGVDETVIQQVCKIIDDLAIQASRECPHCLDAHAKAVLESEAAFTKLDKESD